MIRILTISLALLFVPFLLQAQYINEAAVSERLIQKAQTTPDEQHFVYILLSDHVDVTALSVEFDKQGLPLEERVATLIAVLKDKAEKTQPAFINDLRNLSGVDPATIHPFWITNAIFVEANAMAIATLSNHPEVLWMDMNSENALSENQTIDCAMPPAPNAIEPGLLAINAPALWAMGYTGYGQIAFTADTGIDPWHPAISHKYRGLYANNSETWVSFNPNGTANNNTTPTNCGDHGNHTNGTMLGLDRMTNDTIGVAYGANWVGAAILCGIGTADNVGAFQWALNPDGNPNTITDIPDVINNSWHDPSFPDGSDCFSIYKQILTALETAGVATIFSAGNEGPDMSTITAPHNINTDTFNTFTVGALNGNNPSLTITSFSSRGPSLCGGVGSLLIKPEVSAPGDNVRSCNLDGTYGTKSGTSMAAPHVAGAVLLLKEAFPYLTGKDLLRALYHTCTDLGPVGEDNDYGMGIINVLEAFNLLVDQGNTPVSPDVETDVLLVGISGDDTYCYAAYTEAIFFENAGTTNLTSLDVTITITDVFGSLAPTTVTIPWTGDLPSKERETIVMPETMLPNGKYILEVHLTNPNGIADQKPLNNKGIKRFDLYASDPYDIYLGGMENIQPCTGASAMLFSDYEGEGTIRWYSSPTNNIVRGEGTTFVTPILNSDATYYTELTQSSFAGEPNLDEQTMSTDISNGGLIFDVDIEFTLKSVKVYPPSTGTRYLELYTQGGDLIFSHPLFLFNPGEQRIEVDRTIPVGQNMLMRIGDVGFGLPYSNTADFPYSIGEDLGTIKRSNHPTSPLNTWFYFYDWEVENPNFCERKSIFIDVVPSADIPNAQFATSTDVVDFANNEVVDFTNESTGAVEWLWDFGDGFTSTEENPGHLFENEGSYSVVLTTQGVDGCSDSYTKIINIQTLVHVGGPESLEGQVSLFPNPVTNYLHIQYEFEEIQNLDLKVVDALGRTIHEVPSRRYSKGEQLIDCTGWPNGLYYMVFTNGRATLAKKVVRLN